MRSKLAIILAVMALVFWTIGGSRVGAQVLELNTDEFQSQEGAGAFGLGFSITDESLNTVDRIQVSNPWTGEVRGYWVHFSGTAWTKAVITIELGYSDLPEKKLVFTLRYPKPGYTGVAGAAFALTDWNPSQQKGTAMIQVKTWKGDILNGNVWQSYAIVPFVP